MNNLSPDSTIDLTEECPEAMRLWWSRQKCDESRGQIHISPSEEPVMRCFLARSREEMAEWLCRVAMRW